MARGNLLRQIFKRGPHSKLRNDALASKANKQSRPATVAKTAASSLKAQSQDPSPPRTPESHVVHILPEIAEEEAVAAATLSPSASSSTGSTVSDLASVVTVLAAHTPVIDPTTLTPRDLVYAAIDGAMSATNGHLDTLETTLALLEALHGFSATVEVLRQEMQVKKTACEAKLAELEGFERAVEELTFSYEGGVVGADEGSMVNE